MRRVQNRCHPGDFSIPLIGYVTIRRLLITLLLSMLLVVPLGAASQPGGVRRASASAPSAPRI
jgi:hypothetical protein